MAHSSNIKYPGIWKALEKQTFKPHQTPIQIIKELQTDYRFYVRWIQSGKIKPRTEKGKDRLIKILTIFKKENIPIDRLF